MLDELKSRDVLGRSVRELLEVMHDQQASTLRAVVTVPGKAPRRVLVVLVDGPDQRTVDYMAEWTDAGLNSIMKQDPYAGIMARFIDGKPVH